MNVKKVTQMSLAGERCIDEDGTGTRDRVDPKLRLNQKGLDNPNMVRNLEPAGSPNKGSVLDLELTPYMI